MSLAVLADHMASKGRGPDSMLIHMSPREVQGLQALAMKHGGSLTINPDTGLPEAGFLDKLLPTIIGAGISFFSGGAIDPMTAAAIVGGVQTVRTGDIGAGISAGLGAYGGASLTAGVSNMGAQAGAGEALVGTAAEQAAFDGLTAGAGTPLTAAQYGATASAADLNAAREAMGNSGTFSRGFDAATSKGGMQALNAATKGAGGIGATTALGMAAGPAILAELGAKKNMPQTVTRPGMITPYSFDPYSGTYHAATPYRAAEGGLMGMNSGGYNPGQLDFTQKSEPVVRMAGGGVPGYAPGGFVPSDEDIFNYFKTPGLTDEKIAADMRTFNLSPADIARATGTQNQLADYEQRFAAQSIPAPVAPTYSSTTETGAPIYEEPAYTPTTYTPAATSVYSPEPEPEAAYTPTAYTPTAYTPTPTASYVPSQAAIEPEDTYVAPAGIEALAATLPTAAPVTPKVTDEQIQTWWSDPKNQKLNDAQIKQVMLDNNVTPTQFANAIGANADTSADIVSRYEAALKPPADTIPVTPAASSPVVTAPETSGGLAALSTAATTNGGGLPALNAAVPYYFQVNPDVAKAYAENSYGMTPEAFAQAHYDKYGKAEGREFAPSAAVKYATENKTDLVANTLKWIDTNPFATPEQINAAIKGSGMSTGDVNRALDALVTDGKISGSERYYIQQGKGLSAMADSTAKWLKEHPDATQDQIDKVLKAASMDTGDAQQVLAHGFQVADKDITAATKYIKDNPDVARWITSAQGQAYIKEHPEFDANDIAYTHYKRYGEKEGRKWEAPTAVTTVVGGTGNDVIVPSGYHLENGVLVKNISATQNTTTDVATPTNLYTAPATSLPVGISGATGPSVVGGGATVNPNGTITTSPRIPDIPVGGFTGSQNLRDTYTKGGGSLGYTSPTYTPAEFKTKYEDKLTGGSKQAYDYLTGKKPYSPTPSTPTGEIMKPYAESVLGIPTVSSKKMYLFDPATKQYKINPDYAIPTRDPKTGKNTTSLTNKDVAEFVGKAPTYDALYTWMTTNNLSPEQVATASGKPFTEINKQFLKAQGLAGDDGKIDQTKLDEKTAEDEKTNFDYAAYLKANPDVQAELDAGKANFGDKSDLAAAAWEHYQRYGKAGGRAYTKKAKAGGLMAMARGGMAQQFDLGGYSDGGRLLRGPGDGVSDSIPATIGNKRPARLADGEFVVPARIVSELGNGSTEAGARKLYAMMDRVQAARRGSIGKGKVAKNSRADKYLPA